MKLKQVTESGLDNLRGLFDGTIEGARVVDYDDWDEDKDAIVINGTEYEMGREVSDIDEFLKKHGTKGLVLFRSHGYRGEGCYSGYMKVGGKEYSLDVINEYMVYELERAK